jgi:hypothetical protein
LKEVGKLLAPTPPPLPLAGIWAWIWRALSAAQSPQVARLPRQNEPFAGTARTRQTPLHHHLNLLRARATQTAQRPGTRSRKEIQGTKKGEKSLLAGLHAPQQGSEFPLGPGQSSQFNVISNSIREHARRENFNQDVPSRLSLPASRSAQFPSRQNHPSTPTGSRVAAELHFDTASPWARHSLSPLSRRYVLCVPCCCCRLLLPRPPALSRVLHCRRARAP